MPHEQIGFFAKLIEKELGIVYSEFNYFQLQNRLDEIVKTLSLSSVDELYLKAKSGFSGHLKQLFLDVATNNETSFFRDPRVFAAIRSAVVPEMIEALKAGKTFRIWSAACSFGQEPYSLAILIKEAVKLDAYPGKIEIVATDVAGKALERARKARYTQFEVQRGLSAALMVKYFEKDAEDFWTARPEIRAMVRFESQNLLDSLDKLGVFDLVLCRNVLIYQSVEGKKAIIQRIGRQMRANAGLIMGAGESLIGLSEEFQISKTEDASFYRYQPKGRASAA